MQPDFLKNISYSCGSNSFLHPFNSKGNQSPQHASDCWLPLGSLTESSPCALYYHSFLSQRLSLGIQSNQNLPHSELL